MKIEQLYTRSVKTFSFEFFPPKCPEGEIKLFEAIAQLKLLHPDFVSVTCGAMGTTRENTVRIVAEIKHRFGIEPAAHLTCIGQKVAEIESILEELYKWGIENIVALRGDPQRRDGSLDYPLGDFNHAFDLVKFIHLHPKFGPHFSLAVAGYPEGHIECPNRDLDLFYLKQKCDQGADIVITQLFFSNDDYFNFVARAKRVGISEPIVPGIMPLTNGQQIQRIARMCGARIPGELMNAIVRYENAPESLECFGIDYAVRQVEGLLDGGAPGIHFYTLNRGQVILEIYSHLHNRVH